MTAKKVPSNTVYLKLLSAAAANTFLYINVVLGSVGQRKMDK